MRTRSKPGTRKYLRLSNPNPCPRTLVKTTPSFKYREVYIKDRTNTKVNGRYPDGPCFHVNYHFDSVPFDIFQPGDKVCTPVTSPNRIRGANPYAAYAPSTATLVALTNAPLPNPSRADVVDRLVNPDGNNFFETAASIKDVKGLAEGVLGLGNALAKASRGLGRGNVKITPKALRKTARGAGSAYLSVEFGYKQLVKDLQALRKTIPKLAKRIRRLSRLEGKVMRVGFRAKHKVDYHNKVTGVSVKGTVITRLSYTIVQTRQYSGFSTNPGAIRDATRGLSDTLDYLGLQISAKGAWEILPGSWLIDQMVPVKDLLSDFGSSRELLENSIRVQYLSSTWSRKSDLKVTYRVPVGGLWNIPHYDCTATCKIYERGISYNPPPLFSTRQKFDGISNQGKVFAGLKIDKALSSQGRKSRPRRR